MTEAARTMLESIDEFLATSDYQSVREVWDVLTALRGPDWTTNPTDPRKLATTSVIRQAALPRTAAAGTTGAFFEQDSEAHKKTRRLVDNGQSLGLHFGTHARAAFRGLGLEW